MNVKRKKKITKGILTARLFMQQYCQYDIYFIFFQELTTIQLNL